VKDFSRLDADSITAQPRVSVLMPVFNTVHYLQDALDSIGNQTFTDFELLVVDDGSVDGSTKMLESFAARENRMKLVTRGNLGLIATRNELLKAARGEFVAWMDSDDISLPDRLAAELCGFAKDPALVCLGSAAQCIDPEGNFLNIEQYPSAHPDILVDQQKGGAMRFPTTMMRREAALRVGGFREPFKIGEDFDLLLRLSEIGKMANIPRVLYYYRQHLSSVCAALGPQWPTYRDHILDLALERRTKGTDRLQNGAMLTIVSKVATDMRPLESQVYLSWAQYALRNDNIPLAWRYACAAIARQPASMSGWKAVVRMAMHLRPTVLLKRALRAFSYMLRGEAKK
jgi:glycosyltransferase involved in cell wall biosynthesis